MGDAQEDAVRQSPGYKLMEACGDGDMIKIKELAEHAKFVHDPPGVWGSRDRKAPIHALLQNRTLDANDLKEACKLLLENGTDPNELRQDYDWRGCGGSETAFQMALQRKIPGLLAIFLKHGANPNESRKHERHSMRTDGSTVETLLCIVCNSLKPESSLEDLKALLDAGALVNEPSTSRYSNERGYGQDKSETALHVVCVNGNFKAAEMLLDHGADPNHAYKYLDQVDLNVTSPTDDPRDENFVSSVQLVRCVEKPIHLALQNGHVEIAKLLLARGAKIEPPLRSKSPQPLDKWLGGKSDEINSLVSDPFVWTPQNHKYFAKSTRDAVLTLVRVSHVQKWGLPVDVVRLICSFV